MKRKYKLQDYILFENEEQRDAVAKLLMTVGMRWTWQQNDRLRDCLRLQICEYRLELHGSPLEGKSPSSPSEVMEWTKDMYELLLERNKMPKVKVGEHDVVFNKGSVKIGCTTMTNDEVREVYKHLKD